MIILISFINIASWLLSDLIKHDWSFYKIFIHWCDVFSRDFLILPVSGPKPSNLYYICGIIGIVMISITILSWNFIEWLPFVFTLELYFEMHKFQGLLKEKQGQLKSSKGSNIIARVRLAEVNSSIQNQAMLLILLSV